MSSFLYAFGLFIDVLRVVFFGLAVLVAIVCLLDWLARTGRINRFSGLSRFMYDRVHPLMAPVERRLLRAGGNPQQTPWWTLAAVIVGGIIVISLLQFVGGQLARLSYAASAGPGGILVFLVAATFGLLQIALLARVLSSWFNVSPWSPWIRWAYVLTEWFLAPLRNVIPPIGMMDLSPLVAYFLLRLVEGVVLGALR